MISGEVKIEGWMKRGEGSGPTGRSGDFLFVEADASGEEFGRTGAHGHEGGAGNVLGEAELVRDDRKNRDEEGIGEDGDTSGHVRNPEEVRYDGRARLGVLLKGTKLAVHLGFTGC